MVSDEQKIKAFNLLLRQVEEKIEDEIPHWLEENPYWEIDGDDGLPEHCPPTNEADARDDLCENFISQGEDIGLRYFFEYVVYLIYGEPMLKNNPYREIQGNKSSYEAANEAAASLIKFQKTIFDEMFGDIKIPSIRKEGDKQC